MIFSISPEYNMLRQCRADAAGIESGRAYCRCPSLYAYEGREITNVLRRRHGQGVTERHAGRFRLLMAPPPHRNASHAHGILLSSGSCRLHAAGRHAMKHGRALSHAPAACSARCRASLPTPTLDRNLASSSRRYAATMPKRFTLSEGVKAAGE